MKNALTWVSAVVLIFVGLGFIMPAIAQLRDAGALPTFGVGLLLFGLVLMLGGCGAIFYGARRVA